MPIPVICACGASLKVPEGSAGKTIRCPRCSKPLEVPAVPPPAPAAPPTEETAAPEKACPFCAESIPSGAAVCPFCKSTLSAKAPSPVRRERARAEASRDLSMEAHLRAIAVWYRISGVLVAFLGLVFLALIVPSMGGSGPAAGCGVAVMLLFLAIGAVSFALGHFLGKYSNGARIGAGVLTILGMVGNVIQIFAAMAAPSSGRGQPGGAAGVVIGAVLGLGIGAIYLWAFFNQRSAAICSPGYAALVARSPHLKPRTFASPFFWGPFVVGGLLFVIGVAAGALAAASGGSPVRRF